MFCKFCLTELEENATACPACGRDVNATLEQVVDGAQAEEVSEEVTETAEQETPAVEGKKKPKVWKVALAITGVILLAVILAGVILHFMGLGNKVLHNLKFWRQNDVSYKLSYTVKDDVAEKYANTVIATMGNQTLTNGEFQAHYWMNVFNFLNEYSYYLNVMGVDVNKPLEDQIYDEKTGQTYQQMFIESALNSWYRFATLAQMSQEAGFTLPEEDQKYLEQVEEQLSAMATEYKYADVETFIDEELFPGSSVKGYMDYVRVNHIGLAYYDTVYDGLVPTDAEVEAYFTAHAEEFEANEITKESGNYYDVRHILVELEGGTSGTDDEKVYSDADWENCRAAAQKLLDEFLAGEATEEAFAALAAKHSKDPGSAANGGLYSQLTKDTGFIQGFKDWYLDESRKVGDTGLVKNTESSVQGYHIMYFAGVNPIWEYEASAALLTENTTKLLEEAQKEWPLEVNYKKLVLGYVSLSGQ